jgi:CheY-like chemotaxis protein
MENAAFLACQGRTTHGLEHAAEAVARGAVALTKLRNSRFDFVVTDINMPNMNGFELLTVLRSDPRTRDLPALVLTAKVLKPAEQIELAQAAQGVLTKTSLRRDRLLAEIHRLRQSRPTV